MAPVRGLSVVEEMQFSLRLEVLYSKYMRFNFPILVSECWARSWSQCTGGQPASDSAIHPAVGCNYSPLGLWLPSQPNAGTKLYCLVTEAHTCEQLDQGCYLEVDRPRFEQTTFWVASALPLSHTGHLNSEPQYITECNISPVQSASFSTMENHQQYVK